jgi:hypothetical protein
MAAGATVIRDSHISVTKSSDVSEMTLQQTTDPGALGIGRGKWQGWNLERGGQAINL